MAILAKKYGLMIAGKVIKKTPTATLFQAVDNKTPTRVKDSDKTQAIFDGAFDDVYRDMNNWLEQCK